VKHTGRGFDHPPHLAPRLKKQEGNNSASSLGFHALFWCEHYRLVFIRYRLIDIKLYSRSEEHSSLPDAVKLLNASIVCCTGKYINGVLLIARRVTFKNKLYIVCVWGCVVCVYVWVCGCVVYVCGVVCLCVCGVGV